MDVKQSDRRDMYQTVNSHFDAHPAIVASDPMLSAASLQLSGITRQIDLLHTTQKTTTRGVTLDKYTLRYNLVTGMQLLSGTCWGIDEPGASATIRIQSDFSESALMHMEANRLSGYAKGLLTVARAHSSFLEAQGYSLAALAGYENLTHLWQGSVNDPRKAISHRAAATKEMLLHFKNGNLLLRKRLDRIMKPYRTSDPAFYFGYRSARVIFDTGRRKKEEVKKG